VDILDGTPIIDIKPYIPPDCFPGAAAGWFDAACLAKAGRQAQTTADERFENKH
jgi:tRNA (Thr-GGU) A37 N-methylase